MKCVEKIQVWLKSEEKKQTGILREHLAMFRLLWLLALRLLLSTVIDTNLPHIMRLISCIIKKITRSHNTV
jgi:hypothetical protein